MTKEKKTFYRVSYVFQIFYWVFFFFGPLFFSSDFLFYMIYLIQLFHAFSQRREDVNHVME